MKTFYALGFTFLLSLTTLQSFSQNREALRHEFVKRQDIKSDMALGNYTILATSTSEANAKQIAQEFQKSGHADVNSGYLSTKKLWYIYISSGNNFENAQATRDKYRKIERFKDAWLLTVHE